MGRTNASNFTRMTMTSETDGSGLVFEVQDTSGTPDAPFYAVVNLRQDALREVIKVSSKTGTSLSVASLGDRYLEGSAAGSGITHPNGSQILLAPVAQNLEDLWDAIDGFALSDLADVDTTGAADGDALVFDGTAGEWGPLPIPVPAGIGSNVVQTVVTSSFLTDSTTPVNVPGFAATITPTTADSRVLVMLSAFFTQTIPDPGFMAVYLTATSGPTNVPVSAFHTTNIFLYYPYSAVLLHEPASTSPVTYQVQLERIAGRGGFFQPMRIILVEVAP